MRIAVILTLLIASSPAMGEIVIKSPETRTNLIELYTSEGCSSCPPADQWLSRLKVHPQLWHQLVPIAFHVDYWDYIGWQDRFARPEFSERQRLYARQNNLSTVYTPALVLNGTEWRNFSWGAPVHWVASMSCNKCCQRCSRSFKCGLPTKTGCMLAR